MLKPAQLYEEQLQKKNYETWYDERYIFYHSSPGAYNIQFEDNNCTEHQFVSVDDNDNVIGYISYKVDWCASSADNIGIISYEPGNMEFIKDCRKAVYDLFEKYHLNRVSWFVFADNPAINIYRRFIEEHGGVECAYFRQIALLQDGKLHDAVRFEILAEEFHKGNI